MPDRSVRTDCAGSPRSRPRCSARRTASRNICASTPFQSRLCSAWFCASIRKASGTSKASATSASDEHELVVGTHARDRRQDAEAGEGEIEVEIADRLDQRRSEPDLLARPRAAAAAAGVGSCGSILPPGNAIWPGWLGSSVRSVSSTAGSGRSTTGTSTAAGRVACNAGALPQRRIEVEIAARGRRRVIVERRRHVEGEPRARAAEEIVTGFAARQRHIHQTSPFRLSAGAIAKNSPADAMPNMRRPPTSRSSPSSTRS